MKTVNVQEATAHLARLLDEAEEGEEIVIARAGKPDVRLVVRRGEAKARVLGGWEGTAWIADDFDETPEDLIREFEGETGA